MLTGRQTRLYSAYTVPLRDDGRRRGHVLMKEKKVEKPKQPKKPCGCC